MELIGSDYIAPHLFTYLREITDSKELCIICNIDELSREHYHKDNVHDNVWTRYELPCGCQAHTRCLRKYLSKKNKLHCPKCDKTLDEHYSNTYCIECELRGHVYEMHYIREELSKKTYPECDTCNKTGTGILKGRSTIRFCSCPSGREASRLSQIQYRNAIGRGFGEEPIMKN